MESVNAVANEFLKLANESGKELTNLQLAKLCYIAQGFSLALLDKKAYSEPIEAWKLGPVVPSLYHEFKQYQAQPITTQSITTDPNNNLNFIAPTLQDDNLKKVVALAWNLYKDVSGGALVALTHEGNTPWSLTYVPSENKIISDELIKKYYTKFINNLEVEFLNEQTKTT